MILEIIATSCEEAIAAERAGAHRIELVSALAEGGLTPSFGMVKRTVQSVSIPVRVMVRPHSFGFTYNEDDIRTMEEDIMAFQTLSVSGVVIGALTSEGIVDMETMGRLCQAAGALPVTFHRAIDETKDMFLALNQISELKSVDRVLTSGGHHASAWEARDRLRQLQESTSLQLIAGKGLHFDHLGSLLEQSGLQEIHMGTGVRRESSLHAGIDEAKVREACEILQSITRKRRGT